MKRAVIALLSCILVFSFAMGCKKSENQPLPKSSSAPVSNQGGTADGVKTDISLSNVHGSSSAKTQKEVVVPDDVKKTWKRVVLVIEDKKTRKKMEHVVAIGSEIALADSSVKVKVLHFLPQFIIQDGKVTSVSNNPENPSVRLQVTDADKIIFDNWIYSKHTDIYTFDHPRFVIILKEGLKG